MATSLYSWVGTADLRSAEQGGAGPLLRAVQAHPYDAVVVLTDHDDATLTPLWDLWAAGGHRLPEVVRVALDHPMQFRQIYEGVVEALESRWREGVEATFHLSPGTSAMAAVWILLGKSRFPARLIQSSIQAGVQDADVPFDLAVDFLPGLLRQADGRLAKLSAEGPTATAFADIVARSPSMRRVVDLAQRVARRSVSVVLEGETGVGKELVARAIHDASARRDQPWVAVNCGAIPPELVESTLFGHRRGAFTGAETNREGLFGAADGGTLFLDEVGDLPLAAQVKLLRVLQEGTFTRVGDTDVQRVDVRVLAATHRDLALEVRAGRFREDLFYRLAVAHLRLPPLREREADMGTLIDALLDRIQAAHAKEEPGYQPLTLTVAARKKLLGHPWPGNVRELSNTLVRATVWSRGAAIHPEDITFVSAAPAFASDAVLGRPLGDGLDVEALLVEVQRHYVGRALSATGGNKAKAARLLGLGSATTMRRWMEKCGVGGELSEWSG